MAREIPLAPGPSSARAAAAQLYIHCFPLLLSDTVRRAHPVILNQFHLVTEQGRALAPGLAEDDPCVILTSAWIDLSNEPVVLRLPDTGGRYFSLTLIDTAGEPFASHGSRTGDDGGADVALVGPHWRGELPGGLTADRAPSDCAWAVGRLRAHSSVDLPAAKIVARRQRVAVLAADPFEPSTPMFMLEPPLSPSVRLASDMPPAVFFHRLDAILQRAPAGYLRAVRPVVADLRTELGGPQASSEWPPAFALDLSHGFADAVAAIRASARTLYRSESPGWRTAASSVGSAPLDPLLHAARAYARMGAPVRSDLLSLLCDRDDGGRPLSGTSSYRIRFSEGSLPPVRAFWWLRAEPSAAQSDGSGSAGDRSAPVVNADGSVDLFVQSSPPEAAQLSNWLPVPNSGFVLTMHLYWPGPEALSGAWRMPTLERVRAAAS